MHFSAQTVAALVALLSLSSSLAAPVVDAPHRMSGSVAGTDTVAVPTTSSANGGPGEDASNTVTVPNPTETNSVDPPAPSNSEAAPGDGPADAGNSGSTGQSDSSSPPDQEKTDQVTDSTTKSEGIPPPQETASPDNAPPAGGETIPPSGSTPPPTGTEDKTGESAQALGLSSNSVTPKGASSVDDSAGTKQPVENNKATSSVGKAGLGWNNDSGKRWDQFTKMPGTQVGWSYNWASSKNEKANHPEVNYVPMLHGKAIPGVDDKPALFETNKAKFKEWGVTHILSFNEPDQPLGAGGSAMTVAEAVSLHQKHFTPELASQYKISGPAYSQGKLDDLKAWETQCAGKCPFDFVSLHFYGTNVDGLKGYLDEAAKKFPNKPLWMTEIGCIQYGNPTKYCSDDEVKAFMKDAIPLLHERTERYAWQGSFDHFPNAPADRNNMMEPGSFEINEKGRIFATTV